MSINIYSGFFMKYFLINEHMTGIFEDLEGNDGTKCNSFKKGSDSLQYSPVLTEDKGIDLLKYPNTDFSFIATVGNAGDNKPFCRLFLENNTNDLHCVFRPLVLVDSEKFSIKDFASAYLQLSDKDAADDISNKKTPSKLVWTAKKIFDRRITIIPGSDVGVKKGDVDMLEKWLYKLCYNDRSISDKIGEQVIQSNVTMMESITKIAVAIKPRKIIFSGFSLGAELATAASVLFHARNTGIRVGLVSCCGEPVVNQRGAELISKNFDHKTLVVQNDAVSGISGGLVHPGPVFVVNYFGDAYGRNKRLKLEETYNVKKPAWQLQTIALDTIITSKKPKNEVKSFLKILFSQDNIKRFLQVGAIGGAGIGGSVTGASAGALLTWYLGPGAVVGASVGAIIGGLSSAAFMENYVNFFDERERNFRNYHLPGEEIIPLILWEQLANTMKPQDKSNINNQKKYFQNFGVSLLTDVNDKSWCRWFNEPGFAKKYRLCPISFGCSRSIDGNKFECIPKKNVEKNLVGLLGDVKKRSKVQISNENVKKLKDHCPRIMAKWIGADNKITVDAEGSYITAMNDLSIKNVVARDVVHNINKRFKKNFRFIGSFLVTSDDLYDEIKNTINDVMRMKEAAEILSRYQGRGGIYVFLMGGSIIDKKRGDISHHLAFVWNTMEDNLVSFNPGTACWDSRMKTQAITASLMGTGVSQENFVEDQILHARTIKGSGPQDVMNYCSYRGSGFCQTWAIFWLANYLSGCPAEKWPNSYYPLYTGIRKFILWIIKTFDAVYTVANREFHQNHPNIDILELMYTVYNSIDSNVVIPESGDTTFCSSS